MTTRNPLEEGRLADALVASDGAPGDRAHCPSSDTLWDAARGAGDARSVAALLDHAASCADCALALRTAVEIHAASGLASPAVIRAPTPVRRSTPWAWLTATVLRPEAALAYLLLLAVGIPLLTRESAQRAVDAPAMRAARVIGLESDVVARGAGEPKAVLVDPKGSEAVVLRLFVEPDDLDAASPLRVVLSSGDRALVEKTLAAGSVGESGTLDLTLDVRAIPRGAPLRLTVTAGAERVFDRSLVLAPDAGP